MNTDLELPVESTTETPPDEIPIIPEVLTEEQFTALTDPQEFIKQIEVVDRLRHTIEPTTALALKQLAALAATCTFSARFAEQQRVAIVGPHNKIVDDENAIWMPIVKKGKEKAREIGAIITKAIDDQRKADQLAQQRLIDEANRAQAELDRKAEEDRLEAERLRLEAEKANTPAEKAQLEKKADKLEAKAEQLELKSSQVVTQVVVTQEKTLDLGGVTLSTRAPKNTWMLAGYDKVKPLRITDPKLSALVGDLSTLPEGLQFLLKHADLNPVYLNKSFGVIAFPAPFATVPDYSGSQVRGK